MDPSSMVADLGGVLLAAAEATVPVLDHGFLFGDSVYEVIRSYGRPLFAAEEHLGRLERSAERIGLALPLGREGWLRELSRVQERLPPGDAYFRIIVTRGSGPITLDPAAAEKPLWMILGGPIDRLPENAAREGVEVILARVRRNPRESLDPAIKSGNYLNNVLAYAEARRARVFDSVLLNVHGNLAEGTTSSLFLVGEGVLKTPPLSAGILDGITRRILLSLARGAGIPAAEEDLVPEDLFAAEEAFLSSTIREIVPVVKVSGRPVGSGRPGPLTERMRRLFREEVGRRTKMEK